MTEGVLDAAFLETLAADIGPEPVQGLIDLFLSDAPARMEALSAALDAEDAVAAAKVAHTLKSGAGSVGALAFAALCGGAEQSAREGRFDDAHVVARALPAELSRTATALSGRPWG